MDAAAAALNNLISGSGQKSSTASKTEQEPAPAVENTSVENTKIDTTPTTGANDTTVEQEIAPAVQHETVKHEHETREQTIVDRERHQDHYHTTIQPLKDSEVEETKHTSETAATEERQINNDDQGEDVKAKHDAQQASFQNTTEEAATKETKVTEPTIEGETVHHHLHETIQPVIEKTRIVPEVTHKTIPVHEVVKEPTVDLGVTKAEPISVDQFQGKLSGESKTEVVHDGAHTVPETTAVAPKEN